MVMVVSGLLGSPTVSPVQLTNVYPTLADALKFTLVPASCQVVPLGVTVPLPTGLTDAVNVYCVLKFAVYVIEAEGTVIVCSWAPPSLQESNTYWVSSPPDCGELTPMV